MDDIITNAGEILAAYGITGEIEEIKRICDGHINNTFKVEVKDGSGKLRRYLIQELNTSVFKDPVNLMNNLIGVTAYLRKEVEKNGGDVDRESLYAYPANDGKPYYIDNDGRFWRCFNYIYGAHSEQRVTSPELFRKAAKAFGKFQCMLADYPMEGLVETIPNFHNTVSRFSDFKAAVENNISGRADTCRDEITFALAREKDCSVFVDLIESGDLPLRVTHNDTKLNNVMFDDETGEGICVIDLDTVMPGLSLYDFGDSIRYGASTAAEDEKDLDKVHFSLEYFRAYAEGYLSEAGSSLTKKEIECLAYSGKLMTLECGMRFLGDYLNGDVYFKTEYPEHNLVRCRTQFKLVKEMEEKMEETKKIIEEVCEKLGIEK
ncbi:MAG: aminoglycoside phosphotransferase family protein [Clostridia bacterium]|nr:aminoglycoside phosphotransferase family protein [Clostridia bacterium]